VLRCLIQDDEHGQLVVEIDEQELRLEEFGKLLTTYTGWVCELSLCPTMNCTETQSARYGNPIQRTVIDGTSKRNRENDIGTGQARSSVHNVRG
jgi:hypothetical protein